MNLRWGESVRCCWEDGVKGESKVSTGMTLYENYEANMCQRDGF